MQDSRKTPRKELALALEIDDGARCGRLAVSRNVSTTGLLINTPSRFAVGSKVTVRVHTQDGRVSKLDAEVARVTETGPRSNEPWRYSVGLRFRNVTFMNIGARRKSAALFKLGI